MLRMTKISKKLDQTLRLVLLSGLVCLICLLVTSIDFLSYWQHQPEWSNQSELLLDPKIARANDQLLNNLNQTTESITKNLTHLINQASVEAERQFKRTAGNADISAKDLHNAIELTLAHNIAVHLEK